VDLRARLDNSGHKKSLLLFTVREEHMLRVFEKKVLRKTLQPKRDEVTGEWRLYLYKEEFYSLFTPSIIRISKLRRMSWDGHVAPMGIGEVHTGF
jgi:hypothetical protein